MPNDASLPAQPCRHMPADSKVENPVVLESSSLALGSGRRGAVRARPHYRPLVHDPALSSTRHRRSYIRLFSGGVVGYSWVIEAIKSDMDSK